MLYVLLSKYSIQYCTIQDMGSQRLVGKPMGEVPVVKKHSVT
jgi:hypothetical protein